MKKPLLEQLNIKRILLITILILSVVSCKKKGSLQKISDDLVNKPTMEVEGFENLQSQQGLLKNKITGDVVLVYSNVDTPYYVFPKGIYACTFSDSVVNQVKSDMVADSAVFKDVIGFFVAYGNIVVTNYENNVKLITDGPLYWDSKIEKFYTDAYSVVIRPSSDTIPALEGLIANQDLSFYELRKGRDGVTYVNVDKDSTEKADTVNSIEKNDILKQKQEPVIAADSLQAII